MRSVNTTQVLANWLVGREIVEEEQRGQAKAEYGKRLIEELSRRLLSNYGSGYSVQNLWLIRQLYLTYPRLLHPANIPHALRRESLSHSKSVDAGILYAPRRESWKPGKLHPNLSWTHYRTLLRVDKAEARAFYEIEALKNNWSARELERQKNSLLYERLALSKDKKLRRVRSWILYRKRDRKSPADAVLATKIYVALTDNDWFRFLRSRPELDEVNFWQPGGPYPF